MALQNYTGQLVNGQVPAAVASQYAPTGFVAPTTTVTPATTYSGGGSSAPAPVVTPPTYSSTNPAPIVAGLSQAGSNAIYNTGWTPSTSNVNNSTIGGSPVTGQNLSTNSSLQGGVNTVTGKSNTPPPPLYDTTTGFLTPAGIAAGKPVVTKGDPVGEVGSAPGSFDGQTGTSTTATGSASGVKQNIINSDGSTITVNNDGSISYAPSPAATAITTAPTQNSDGTWTISAGTSPAVATIYTQGNNVITSENSSFSDANNSATAEYNQAVQTITKHENNLSSTLYHSSP